MYFLNKSGVKSLTIYLLCFAWLCVAVLCSGLHAPVSGGPAAMMIPIRKTPGAPDAVDSPLHMLEHAIAPWSAFLIVPFFGFANAGVRLAGMGVEQLLAPLPLGIAAGLFLGKQIGIFGSVWLCTRCRLAGKLRGATWLQISIGSTSCRESVCQYV